MALHENYNGAFHALEHVIFTIQRACLRISKVDVSGNPSNDVQGTCPTLDTVLEHIRIHF